MKNFVFLLVLLLGMVAHSYSYGVLLIGGGGGQKLIGMEKYKDDYGDLKIEMSGYSINPKTLMFFQRGAYAGMEINSYQVRPYIGLSEILIGLNVKERIPLLYLGASGGVIGDLNRKKEFYSDLGVECSLWIGTLAGAIELTERTMIQEYYQTRIDYIFKLPFFGDTNRPKSK